MILFFVLFLFLFPTQVDAVTSLRLNRFGPFDTTLDWVEVCNDSSESVNLASHYIVDAAGNKSYFDCLLQAQKCSVATRANWLNNSDGDSITLKNGDSVIDTVSYSVGGSFPEAVVDLKNFTCAHIESSAWKASTNQDVCTPPSNVFCTALPTSTPSPTSSPTPSPTSSVTPSATSVPAGNPSVSISLSSSSLKINQTYTLNFTISNPVSGHNYYLKVFGGTNNSAIQTQNGSSWLSYTSDWDKFPQYPANNNISFRFKDDESTGSKNIYLRIKDSTSSNDYDSQSISINLSSADPTSTSTPKVTSTPSITQTPTPEPTAYLEPLPTDGLFQTSSPTAGLIAGLSDEIVTSPTPKIKSSNPITSFIPVLLVTVGGLFLTAPLIISKIRPA